MDRTLHPPWQPGCPQEVFLPVSFTPPPCPFLGTPCSVPLSCRSWSCVIIKSCWLVSLSPWIATLALPCSHQTPAPGSPVPTSPRRAGSITYTHTHTHHTPPALGLLQPHYSRGSPLPCSMSGRPAGAALVREGSHRVGLLLGGCGPPQGVGGAAREHMPHQGSLSLGRQGPAPATLPPGRYPGWGSPRDRCC